MRLKLLYISMNYFTSCSPRVRRRMAFSSRLGEEALWRPHTLPPTARVSWLSRDGTGHRRRMSPTTNCGWRMKGLCWVYSHAACPSYGESLQDLTVDGLRFAPEVRSWPLLPHSKNI